MECPFEQDPSITHYLYTAPIFSEDGKVALGLDNRAVGLSCGLLVTMQGHQLWAEVTSQACLPGRVWNREGLCPCPMSTQLPPTEHKTNSTGCRLASTSRTPESRFPPEQGVIMAGHCKHERPVLQPLSLCCVRILYNTGELE